MRSAVAWSALALLAPTVALAQEPPPSSGSVPSGAAGAVPIVKDAPPEPKRDISKATPPKPLNNPQPTYPPEAEKAGLEGEVILKLSIDKDGKILKAVVDSGAGHGFDEAALQASKQLAFTPARWSDGTSFAAVIKYRFTFHLTPKAPTPEETKAAEQRKLAVFTGTIFAGTTDAPIAGATISLSPGALEASTDEHGSFGFRDVPPGTYSILVKAPGYAPFSVEEALVGGEATDVKYRLKRAGGALEVTVEGDRPPREVTKRTLEQREIDRIPGTNGDALKSLQSLPGVARPPGIAGLLIVRGSAPEDTQVFIDGTAVPIIYHFFGLTSVVPTEVLQKIDFYPGNFGDQYGRAQGGIVDVGLRNPKPEYHGVAQIDFIDARLMVEGPIPGLSGWTFLAAGRRSIIGDILAPILSAAGATVTAAPAYYDYQFLIAKKPTPTSNFRIAVLGSDDAIKLILDKPSPGEPALTGDLGLHTAFQRLQMRYDADFGDNGRVDAVVAVGRDVEDVSLGPIFIDVDARSVSGRLEYGNKLGRIVRLNAGLDMLGGDAIVNLQVPPPPTPGSPPNGPFSAATAPATQVQAGYFQPAAYLEAEVTPDARTRLIPGIRVDYYNQNKALDVSPRTIGRYDIHKEFPRTTIKGGVGLYYQPPQFYEVNPPFGNANLSSERSTQYDLGVEQEFTKQVEISVEGFYKRLDNQVVSTASPSGSSVVYTNQGTGRVGGMEVLLKYKPDKHFFGWVAYTLSRSVRVDGPGQAEHLFQYDQPHILTVLGSYDFRNGWEFGARFRLVSGSPITPNVCDITSAACLANRTNALYNAATGTYTAIPATAPYGERLPLFHQLDMRVDHKWAFKSWTLRAYLDVQNVYNQANVEGIGYNFNYTARSYVSGLPIIPSIGLRGEL